MAIKRKPYELSVWDEKLGDKGTKEEIKRAIIGSDSMNYLGRATNIKLTKKLNGTSALSFQLPSKFFDSQIGEYVHNEFCDYLFNERKIKLKFDGEWFEYYIKTIQESKQFKSIIYKYDCQDAFIDELSRNGYGITFDTELYNNVEELGTFNETILKDSIWNYDSSKNTGDFTEYNEEKLFKIPISWFKNSKISGYKISYDLGEVNKEDKIYNVYSGEYRNLEMGDDLARDKELFWDSRDKNSGIELLDKKNYIENIATDGFIYIPYSQLGFCYHKNNPKDFQAIAEPQTDTTGKYYIAPTTVDSSALIQFIVIPPEKELLIDETGLIINKDIHYIMTIDDWNNSINSDKNYFIDGSYFYSDDYNFTDSLLSDLKLSKKEIKALSVKAITYDGYLDSINDKEVSFGKKISIADRTIINISEDIDQYVKVYNSPNPTEEFKNMFSNPEDWQTTKDKYRLCSHINTRTIVPQLARNLVQNGTNIKGTSGWGVMAIPDDDILDQAATISNCFEKIEDNIQTTYLCLKNGNKDKDEKYRTFINFGLMGQEQNIEAGKIYCFMINVRENKQEQASKIEKIIIGEGSLDSKGEYRISSDKRIEFDTTIPNFNFEKGLLFKTEKTIKNPYLGIQISYVKEENNGNTQTIIKDGKKITKKSTTTNGKTVISTSTELITNNTEFVNNAVYIKDCFLFEAYTKGRDFFEGKEIIYKYSGRDLFCNNNFTKKNSNNNISFSYVVKEEQQLRNMILFETDVMEGAVYEQNKYFIQQIQYKLNDKINETKDTFGMKEYLDEEKSINYTEDDYKIITNYLDMNKCPYYQDNNLANGFDCSYDCQNKADKVCMYQKYGYCPHLFKTEKHCRKVRTLNGEKSNRFNLTQELSKVFECYPIYYIEHYDNGKIVKDSNGKMKKTVFYITEKGIENKLGFRYEKNLSNISRTFDSNQIVTKLYIQDVDSDLSKTGLCSIKTAEDNPSKDSFIIDFSYYILRGLLDKEATNADLYGVSNSDKGFLKQLGYYNTEYDRYSNLIIQLQDKSFTELEANVQINLEAIETAKQEYNKIKIKKKKYTSRITTKADGSKEKIVKNETYINYETQENEQQSILNQLYLSTFANSKKEFLSSNRINKINNLRDFIEKYNNGEYKKLIENKLYYSNSNNSDSDFGMMAQYCKEYQQIKEWKKARAAVLNKINKLSLSFYQKYEPYLKEGTWSDSNYLSDNTYYHGATEVAKQGAIPKITYSISVVDLDAIDDSGDYKFRVADTTYIEDIETFGVNQKTGLPNRLKVIISGITYDLDIPSENSIEIQNYTTQFADLFEQISASVQSLSFNENIYKRSSNFTATKNVNGESLQGALNENDITLLETDEKNLEINSSGQSGSDINNHTSKYKLNGQGLSFSNDGGVSWNIGVGPEGINADYIKVGSLDVSKVQLMDNDYVYFLWDKTGITAYRDPNKVNGNDTSKALNDFARFNKYGLSLVEDNKIRLRAGYDFSGKNGDVLSEAEIEKDKNIGFYLYDKKGNKIFSTTSVNGDDQNNLTARISLTGEMFITDNYSEDEIDKKTEKLYNMTVKKMYIFENSDLNRYTNKMSDTDNIYVILRNEKKEITEEVSGNYEIDGKIFDKLIITTKINTGSPTQQDKKYFIENGKTLTTTPIYEYNIRVEDLEKYLNSETGEQVEETNQNVYSVLIYTTQSNLNTAALVSGTSIYYNKESSAGLYRLKEIKEQSELKIENYLQPVLPVETVEYLDFNNNVVKKTLYAYRLGNVFQYWEKCEKAEEKTITTTKTTAQSVGVFLNNKLLNKEEENSKEKDVVSRRIFSCIIGTKDGERKDSSKTNTNSTGLTKRNILTILKNGRLYIGGTVLEENGKELTNTSMENIPDIIQIKSPQILMTQDGIIKMDFNKFQDMDGNSLIETINEAVASINLQIHSHDLDSFKIEYSKNQDSLRKKYFYFPIYTAGKPSSNKASEIFSRSLGLVHQGENKWGDKQVLNYLVNGSISKDVDHDSIKLGKCLLADVDYTATGQTATAGSSSTNDNVEGMYFVDPISK